jgi:uncharacterized protein YgiM (DUF1202 family)
MMNRSISRSASIAAALPVCALVAFIAVWNSGIFTARAQEATGFSVDEAVVISADGDGLNLREDASSSANVISVLPDGTFAVIIDGPFSDGTIDWYLVQVDSTSGYVAGEFLVNAATDVIPVDSTVYVSTDALNLRSDASTSSGILTELPTNTVATVLDGPVDADGYSWYQVDVDGTTGWVVRDFLAFAGVEDALAVGSAGGGATLLVDTDSLNVRDAAGLGGSVLETISFGDSVSDLGVTETVDGFTWQQIQTASGVTGWVVSSYLTANADDLLLTIGSVATVNTDTVNLRDAAGLSGAVVGELVNGDSVTILSASEAADGYLWYQVDTALGTGWVAGEFLTV